MSDELKQDQAGGKVEGKGKNREKRPPKNMMELLSITTEAESIYSERVKEALDEESRNFLKGALSSMTVNVQKELLDAIQAIDFQLKTGKIEEKDCDQAFAVILNFVEEIDYANDFYKLGGLSIIEPCLKSNSECVQWNACELIGYLCQNNPLCQNACLEEGVIPPLVDLLKNEENADHVRVKATFAISCLVRGNDEGLATLLEDGQDSMLGIVQSLNSGKKDMVPNWKREEKLTFMLYSFAFMMNYDQKVYFLQKEYFGELFKQVDERLIPALENENNSWPGEDPPKNHIFYLFEIEKIFSEGSLKTLWSENTRRWRNNAIGLFWHSIHKDISARARTLILEVGYDDRYDDSYWTRREKHPLVGLAGHLDELRSRRSIWVRQQLERTHHGTETSLSFSDTSSETGTN